MKANPFQAQAPALQFKSSMQNLTAHIAIKTLVLMLSAQSLVACAPNGTSMSEPHSSPQAGGAARFQPNLSNVTPSSSTGNAPLAQAQGTGDLGGGNGLNGKVFESYTVDILKTPEYKNRLSQIDQHLESFFRPDDPKQQGPAITAFAAKYKRWFIAPVSLHTLSKEKLGVGFAMDPVQQFALQNDNEIWIDKNLLPKTEDERALLYLHESVMNFYLIQFRELEMTTSETSNPGNDPIFQADAKGLNDLMKALFAPRPKRALNAEDYANVRAVTDYLWNHLADLRSYDDIKKLFMRHGFDRRLFGEFDPIEFKNNEASRALPDSKINAKTPVYAQEFLSSLRKEGIAGRLPKFCDFDDIGNSNGICRFGQGATQNLGDKFTTLSLQFEATNSENKLRQNLKLLLIIPNKIESFDSSLAAGFRNSNVTTRKIGLAYPLDEQGRVITDLKEGDVVWSVSAHMTGDQSFQKLTALQLTPHIVAKSEKLLSPNDVLFTAVVPDNSVLKTELVVNQQQISGKPYVNSSGPRGEIRIYQGDLKQIRDLQEKISP